MLHHHAILFVTLLSACLWASGCSQSDETNSTEPAETAADTVSTSDDVGDAAGTDSSSEPGETPDNDEPVTIIDGPSDVVPQGPHQPEPSAEGTDNGTAETATADATVEPDEPPPTKLPEDLLEDAGLQPLNENNTVLLDLEGKRLLLRTTVCLTLGQLEMLVCLKQTKEHESILTLDSKAFTIHTGLLALGCEEGTPFRYDPDTETFHAPQGQPIDIFVHWVDTDGNLQRDDARKWVRHSRYRYYEESFDELPAGLILPDDGDLRWDAMNNVIFWYGPMNEAQRKEHLALCDDEKYQKAIHRFFEESQSRPMAADWLFVGSHFYEDEERGRQYLAEGGYVVCVANFSMALLDLSGESSAGGDSLTYEAWTERIPPRDSEVLVELVPRKAAGNDDSASLEDAASREDQ